MITLKQNLRVGETVLRGFKKEFPVLKSNTLIYSKIIEHENSEKYQRIRPLLQNLAVKYGKGVLTVRDELAGHFFTLGDYVNKLKKVLSTNKYANCMEEAHLIKHELLNKGEKPHLISIRLRDSLTGRDKPFGDHGFAVFGLKPDAILASPKTWGGKAVVVDPWSNVVAQSREAIEMFKMKLGFNPTKDIVEFRAIDSVKVS